MSHSTGAGPGVATPRPETINHLPDQGSTDYILPVVIVCANYQFDASPNLSDESLVRSLPLRG